MESCLNNILLICEDDYVIEHFINEIEEKSDGIFKFLLEPRFNAIYEQILSILFRILNHKKALPIFFEGKIDSFELIFKNSQFSFNNLFQVINQVLIYEKKSIQENLVLLEKVKKKIFFF